MVRLSVLILLTSIAQAQYSPFLIQPAPTVVTRVGDIDTLAISSSQSGSVSITVPGGATMMVVTVTGYGSANIFSGHIPTQNTVAMTVGADGDNSASFMEGEIFYIPNPTSGNFAWNWGEVPTNVVVMQYGFYVASGVRHQGAQQGAGANFSVGPLTALSGDMIVACQSGNNSNVAWTGGATEITELHSGSATTNAYAENSPSGNTTVTTTLSAGGGTDGSLTAIVLRP